MQPVFQDLRYGFRTFARNRRFSLTLMLVLALGIGGTTAMFTLLYGVVLQPLPFKDADRLVRVVAVPTPEGDSLVWWSQSQAFASLCEYRSGGINLTEGDWPTRVSAAVVSANFFSVFEVSPQLGRPFIAEDERPGHNRIAILSDHLWTQNFGRDPNISGRSITLNSIAHTIIGVMPAGFGYPGRTAVWVPRAVGGASLELGEDDQADLPLGLRNAMVGRLGAGVTLARAQSDLQVLFARLKETYAKSGVNYGDAVTRVVPLQQELVGAFRSALLALFAGVGFLLLIACANAANLLLVRGAARQKEIAIRLSLGASSSRIVRQVLSEAVLLTTISGSLGTLLAYGVVETIRKLGPRDIPRLAEIRLDPIALSFALGMSLLVGVAVGLAPALQTLRLKLTEALKEQGATSIGGGFRRIRQATVIAQVALSLVLLMGAGLTLQSFFRLTNVTPGFDATGVMTMDISLPAVKYGEPLQPADVGEQLQEKPGKPASDEANPLALKTVARRSRA
ncbi:MAG: ABC transporter permease, partial [candidate division WOR-3 bacterium]